MTIIPKPMTLEQLAKTNGIVAVLHDKMYGPDKLFLSARMALIKDAEGTPTRVTLTTTFNSGCAAPEHFDEFVEAMEAIGWDQTVGGDTDAGMYQATATLIHPLP